MRMNNLPVPRPAAGARLPLIVFVNAGDPSLDATADLLRALDDAGVAGVELCVPYANPFTDGATLRRSHERALANGIGLDDVLALVAGLRRDGLHLPLYLMVDWSHTVRGLGIEALVARIGTAHAQAQLQGLLVHGLPPRLRDPLHRAACAAGLPLVRTRYLGRPGPLAAETGPQPRVAFDYLVASYGASGGQPVPLADTLADLPEVARDTSAPRYVGFGVLTADDVAQVLAAGADGAVIGSAFVAALERHLSRPETLGDHARDFIRSLCAPANSSFATEKGPSPCLP